MRCGRRSRELGGVVDWAAACKPGRLARTYTGLAASQQRCAAHAGGKFALKGVNMGAEGCDPVGGKGVLHEGELVPAHMRRGKIDSGFGH
jgi:hypothetical protein